MQTPLQLAVLNEVDARIIKVLLKYGGDATILDPDGNNVIHLAVLHSNENILATLIHNVNNTTSIDSFNYDGLTPLMICASNNNIQMAKLLLEREVDPNTKDQKSGRTALFHAVESNDGITNSPQPPHHHLIVFHLNQFVVEMVKLLLDYKADAKVKNFLGMSAHEAVFEIDDLDKRIAQLILGKDTGGPGKGRGKRKMSLDGGDAVQQDKNKVKIAMERRYQKCYLNNKVHPGGT